MLEIRGRTLELADAAWCEGVLTQESVCLWLFKDRCSAVKVVVR
jgi:hypothetical protein